MQTKTLLAVFGTLAFTVGVAGVVVIDKVTRSGKHASSGDAPAHAPVATNGAAPATTVPAGAEPAPASAPASDADPLDPATETLRANEELAISTLVAFGNAQSAFQSAGSMDIDGDGVGEYAWLGELAGTIALREKGPDGKPRMGTAFLEPALLPARFGAANGQPERSGYIFRLYLPGTKGDDRCPGIVQGAPTFPDPINSAACWIAYAWPVTAGVTGNRVFFLNQEGVVFETGNADKTYSGPSRGPAFDAALSTAEPKNMLAPVAGVDKKANDRHAWKPVER